MPPNEIVAEACDNIIMRMNVVKELLYSIQSNNDEYSLTINGETDTVGNLLMRAINDLYPDIRAAVYSASNKDRTLLMRIRCDEDINVVYNSAIKYVIKTYNEIKQFF